MNKLILVLAVLTVGFISCDDDKVSSDKLLVKFYNDAESEYTITGIQLLEMGEAGTAAEPTGEFSENILKDGKTLQPGEFELFVLELPNLHYAYYRLTVDDGTGAQVLLHDQTGYVDLYEGTITHWGGDDRTVSVTLSWNNEFDYIYVQTWIDWVGIE